MDKPGRVRELLIAAAAARGLVHTTGARSGKVNESGLSKLLGIPQPTVHRFITGEIRKPSPELLDAMLAKLGVSPDDLLGHATVTVTAEAAAIASRIAALPPTARQWFERHLSAYERFATSSPQLAELLVTPQKGDYLAHEKRMESVSAHMRAGSGHVAKRAK
jgi:transcriptional regulator with XRE-family HTH domain